MADEGSPEHDAVFVINRRAGLTAHFRDCPGGNSEIIRRSGTKGSHAGRIML